MTVTTDSTGPLPRLVGPVLVRGLAFVSIWDKRPRGRHAVAAVPISIEIDEMLALFLQTRGLDEIAFDLIDRLKAICGHLKFIAIFAEALIARRVLTELGVKL
jgi:hypothetical protein